MKHRCLPVTTHDKRQQSTGEYLNYQVKHLHNFRSDMSMISYIIVSLDSYIINTVQLHPNTV